MPRSPCGQSARCAGLLSRSRCAASASPGERGWSWEQIGDALGVSRQSIHAKYGRREQ